VNQTFFPTVSVNGFQNLGNSNQQQRLQGPIRGDAFNDNLTFVHNSHVIKAGFEFRYSSNLDRYSPTAGGSFAFNSVATGSALAALELGWVQQGSLVWGSRTRSTTSWSCAAAAVCSTPASTIRRPRSSPTQASVLRAPSSRPITA
jgi:hypothetical protein